MQEKVKYMMKKRIIKKVELLLEGREAAVKAFRGDIYPIRNIDIDDDYDYYYKDYEKALMLETSSLLKATQGKRN